jgi:hypothetical protein
MENMLIKGVTKTDSGEKIGGSFPSTPGRRFGILG